MHFAMRTIRFPHLLAAALLFTFSSVSHGGNSGPLAKPLLESDYPFEKGVTELQIVAGPFFHLKPDGKNERPRTDYVQGGLRYGWMLSSPGSDGILRGNLEFLLEAFGAGVFEGPGTFFTGADMMLRYNFVQPGARWIPYIHILAGGLYNNIYKNKSQGLIDTRWEWYLGGDLGLRYLITDKVSISLEAGYRHISNADTGDRNYGLNSLGTTIGVSWYF